MGGALALADEAGRLDDVRAAARAVLDRVDGDGSEAATDDGTDRDRDRGAGRGS
jgi:hypothetical protein